MDITNNEVELLTVNKEKIKDSKPIGYENPKTKKTLLKIKKTGETVAKLAVMAAAAIMETPILKSAVNAVGAMEANRIMGYISKIVGNIKNMPLTKIGNEWIQSELYTNMTHPEGKYAWVGYLVHFCVNLAINHPGIIIAGGALLAGFITSKIVYPVIQKIVRMAKGAYQKASSKKNASEIQLQVYNDIKKILESKYFKKIKNHYNFGVTLNNAVKIVGQAKKYETELNNLHNILEIIYEQMTRKEIKDFAQSNINVQTVLKEIEYKSYKELSSSPELEESKKKR